jgi:hypothetical protein
VADARYTAFDERIVRVRGPRFEPASQYTVKLQSAAITGYDTVSFARIRDPLILRWLGPAVRQDPLARVVASG